MRPTQAKGSQLRPIDPRDPARRSPLWISLVVILTALAGGCDSSGDALVEGGSTATPSTQGFAGSAACAACHGPFLTPEFHGTYYQDWLESAHGRTADMTPAAATIVADQDGNGSNDFEDGLELGSSPAWQPFTGAGGAQGDFAPILGFEAGDGVFTVTLGSRVYDLHKVVGIGRHRQVYLTRIGNSAYVLPILYEVGSTSWRPFEPHNWYTWNDANGNGLIDAGETVTGLLYATSADTPVSSGRTADAWERTCAGCHVTGIASVGKNDAGEFIVDSFEDGVACEACHGPGLLHTQTLGGRGFADRAIVNPTSLEPDRQRDICMSCHTRGQSVGSVDGDALHYPLNLDGSPFVPGQPLDDALVISASPREPIHELQGNEIHRDRSQPVPTFVQDCQDCHSAHNTTNLALVRMSVMTPSSGVRDVLFTSRSGPPGTEGVMGDATNGVFTEICEVCHTETEHFRNDGSTPLPDHFNGQVCTACHAHDRGFVPQSGGGIPCSVCHDYLFSNMNDPTPEYRHLLDDDAIDYPQDLSALRCLSCHVDHDIFGPDRAANLRTHIVEIPTESSGFTNSDFVAAEGGGICISCHTVPLAKSYPRPDGSAATPAIPYPDGPAQQAAAYQAGMHGGDYKVASQFGGGGTNVFLADCSKCHNDDLEPKSSVGAQLGPIEFGLHRATHSGMLAPLGVDGATEPLEEQFCWRCHSRPDDAIGGTRKTASGLDWYGVESMSDVSEDLWTAFGLPFAHGVASQSGEHAIVEGTSPGWNAGPTRHVECADCHNPHAVGPSRPFDRSGPFAQPLTPTNLTAATPLAFVWGVDVAWPGGWTTPDPATAYTRVDSSTFEWQVCLKCHSGYGYGATPPAGETDQALEFNPNNVSYHAVIGASQTTFPPNSSFVAPWQKDSPMGCSDCHTVDAPSAAQGPHGSHVEGILAGELDFTTGQPGTEEHLCFKCHSFNVYGRNGTASGNATGFSGDEGNLHRYHMGKDHFSEDRKATCVDCHSAVPHGWQRRALLVVSDDPAPYNGGTVGLSPLDVDDWPASGNWDEDNCSNAPCHD